MKTIIIWTAAFVTLAALAFAGVPQTINYQGYLKDASGAPVGAKTSVVFSLYSSNPARSNPVWQEARAVEPVNGSYSIQLGLKNAISAPFDVPYWLGVRVENDPEMALQPLSSAPYALRAATADGMNAGPQTLLTGGAANTGLVVRGAAGQTANLQEWQNSSAAPVASISPGGDLTLTGNLLLPVTTATGGIIKSGADTLIHAFGDRNFFAGIGAGNLGMSGSGNTATGYQALAANSSGYSNTAMGYRTLYRNTTAGRNTALGIGALASQSYNADNVVWDSFNTAVGSDALTFNQPTSTSNGSYNTAIGGRSLEYNNIGYNNVGVGYKAGLPESSGYAQTSGYNNTFIGAFSGLGTPAQVSNSTAIGYNSRVSTSNSLALGGIGADAVKVGIGTAAPTESLDVVGNVKISGTLSAGSLAPGAVTVSSLADSSVTASKIAAGAVTSDNIADVQRTISYPARSMSYTPGSTIIQESAFGLLFQNSYLDLAHLVIPRPADWTGTGSVLIRLFVYTTTATTGTMQFFMRPRTYASGDSTLDVLSILSTVATVSGIKYYELQVPVPAANFGTKPWWDLNLQRNPLTYAGDAVVMSVAIEYTAVR
ncbi:MAG: hypothetical protein ACOYL3_12015 [Desulfuromonadaceae bacterium]